MSHSHASDQPLAGRDPNNLVAVIMAGGAGTRFWPVSTQKKPKQFLKLFGKRTLIQESFDRLKGIVGPERILVLTNTDFVPLVQEQLPDIPSQQIIGEPYRRDTAAAVALATLLARKLFGNCTTIIVAADHRISPTSLFQETILSAADAATHSNALYTLGIKPTYPATGYGYLQRGERLLFDDGPEHYRLQAYKEKPALAAAQQFLAQGGYYWNSGMFVWHTDAILQCLRQFLPDLVRALEPVMEAFATPDWPEQLAQAFRPLPKISVDLAIMEKAPDVRMVAAGFDWRDLGGWLALEPFLDSDNCNNKSSGRMYCYQSQDNIVFTDEPEESIALVGVSDMVVVHSGHRTLVVPKDRLEDVKQLVNMIREELR